MTKQTWSVFAVLFLVRLSANAATAAVEAKPSEPGIPVTDDLVKERCGTCHQPDSQET